MNTLAPAENPQINEEQVTENNSQNIESPNNIDSSENPSGIKNQSDGSIPIAITKPQSTNLSKIEEEDLASSPKLSAAQCQKADSVELTGHKLHSSWTLYVDKTPNAGSSLQDYTQNLKKIYKVSTIEGFWQVFNNIPTPNNLHPRYSFHLMRGDRRPIWEDPLNENGGYWKLKCHKTNTELVWRELVLAAIGEQFRGCLRDNVSDNIVGVSVSIRDRDDHFQIWNENWEGAQGATVVEKVTKTLLPKMKFHSTFYKEHKNHHKFEKNVSNRMLNGQDNKMGNKKNKNKGGAFGKKMGKK